ncbi:MAG: hypothetical protein HLUCCA11_24035 [Phormidesmis priestleyi Ana]|uniref:Uncharacterized protein n=1 Tax=Phormidesmis priestleyi Ana TaxID=1666911 RepID=A0A0P7Z8Z7_9CYAN|nr:MAG: hypothetical protein HLUCCA11_24035 [Phormidesmis priestleyi Ana]
MPHCDLNALSGTIISRYDLVTGYTDSDIFEFDILRDRHINSNLYDISAGDCLVLFLFYDQNNNSILDSRDRLVVFSASASNAESLSPKTGTTFYASPKSISTVFTIGENKHIFESTSVKCVL